MDPAVVVVPDVIGVNGGKAGTSIDVGGDGECALEGRGGCNDEDCEGGRVCDDEGYKARGGGDDDGASAVCMVGGGGFVVVDGDGIELQACIFTKL
ncbi:conserved hypothetical protein [Ricinus communis]|uniref:Uncharacterized protein n=1 Tax=Ricinus communis TaxID=3988 RepID=B9SCQ0_RICCO|nr:conserved hypothetical protein [Ricinus communis]